MTTGYRIPHLTKGLGFGVSGPHATRLTTPAQTKTLIQQAFASGVRVFDTAPFYGGGEAERRLGAALADLPREKVFVATKAGTSWLAGRAFKDFSPATVLQSLDRSLTRMGLDYVDALFLHGPDPSALTDELLSALIAARETGRVHHLGVCGRGPELDAAFATGMFDLVMAPSRLDQSLEHEGRISQWRWAGKPVIGFETLAPANTGRRAPRTPADFWALARAAKTGALSQPRSATLSDCLSWAAGPDGPDVTIVMTTRAKHLTENAREFRHALDGSAAPA